MNTEPKPVSIAKLLDNSCRVIHTNHETGEKRRNRCWAAVESGWLTDGYVAIKIPEKQRPKIEKMVATRVEKFKLEGRGPDVSQCFPATRPTNIVSSRQTMEVGGEHTPDFEFVIDLTPRTHVTRMTFDADPKDYTSYYFDTHYLLAIEKMWPNAWIRADYRYSQYSGWNFRQLCFYAEDYNSSDPSRGLVGLLMRLTRRNDNVCFTPAIRS